MSVALRIKHKLTAHHWRHDHNDKNFKYAICSCGWKPRWWKQSWRWRYYKLKNGCYFKGHKWDRPWAAHTGELDFVESADTYLGSTRQCVRCYECEDVDIPWDDPQLGVFDKTE